MVERVACFAIQDALKSQSEITRLRQLRWDCTCLAKLSCDHVESLFFSREPFSRAVIRFISSRDDKLDCTSCRSDITVGIVLKIRRQERECNLLMKGLIFCCCLFCFLIVIIKTGSLCRLESGLIRLCHPEPWSMRLCYLEPGSVRLCHLEPGSVRMCHLESWLMSLCHFDSGSVRLCHLDSGSLRLCHLTSGYWDCVMSQGQ